MQKLFRLTALLAVAMLVVWVVGCGGDDDDDVAEPAATVTNVTPTDGATDIPGNTAIEVEFDNAVESCTIAGKEATLSSGNKKAKIDDAGLSEGQQEVTIAWTNKDGSAGEGETVTYTVIVPDTEPPKILNATPADGDDAVVPDDVNVNGIVIEFDEDIDTAILTLTLEDVPINWKVSVDGATVTLNPLKGADLSFEKTYVLSGTVSDGKNEAEISITFTTKSKE